MPDTLPAIALGLAMAACIVVGLWALDAHVARAIRRYYDVHAGEG